MTERLTNRGTKKITSKSELFSLIEEKRWNSIYNRIKKQEIPYNVMSTTFGKDHKTLAHFASEHGELDLLQLVLTENKTLLQQKDERSHSPIFFAIKSKEAHTVVYLHSLGARCPPGLEDEMNHILDEKRRNDKEEEEFEKSEEEEMFIDLVFLNDEDEDELKYLIKDIEDLNDQKFKNFLLLVEEEFKKVNFKHFKLISIKSTFRRNLLNGLISIFNNFKDQKKINSLYHFITKESKDFALYLKQDNLCFNEENLKLIQKINKKITKFLKLEKDKNQQKTKKGKGKGKERGQTEKKTDTLSSSTSSKPKHNRSYSFFRNKPQYNTSKFQKKLIDDLDIEITDSITQKKKKSKIDIKLSKTKKIISSKVTKYLWTNNNNKPVIMKTLKSIPDSSSSKSSNSSSKKRQSTNLNDNEDNENDENAKLIKLFKERESDILGINCKDILKIHQLQFHSSSSSSSSSSSKSQSSKSNKNGKTGKNGKNGNSIESMDIIMDFLPQAIKYKDFIKYYQTDNFEKYNLITQLVNIFFYLENKNFILENFNFLVTKNKKEIKLIFDNYYSPMSSSSKFGNSLSSNSNLSSSNNKRKKRKKKKKCHYS